MTRVEQFEVIRRLYYVDEKSKRCIARDLGVHRRKVRQALASAVPPPRKVPTREPKVLTGRHRRTVDQWLLADRQAPKKQRHTGRRIYQRLRDELAYAGAESTVRGYVGRRRRELGVGLQGHVPRHHEPGKVAEVDWYEAVVEFPDRRRTVQIFSMRACCSGREFHMAFPRATQQAFLEGHVAAFEYFGGCFHTIRYDNLTSAVKRVLRGRRREQTERFITLRSHYVFEAEFCQPGKKGAAEKGGVEGGLGRFRRTHLVPVPAVADFVELNEMLAAKCVEDLQRTIEGRSQSIAAAWPAEAARLRALPDQPLPTAQVRSVKVDTKGRVKLHSNFYSVPIRLRGLRVEARVYAMRIELFHRGKLVASHVRLQGRSEVLLELDHYLELLVDKPGALTRSLPLHQARQRGEWPVSYDQLWHALEERYGAADGTRQLLTVLMLHREHPAEAVHTAVEAAVAHGAYDAAAVKALLRRDAPATASPPPLQDLGELQRYERPLPAVDAYDQLLSDKGAA